jgi:hypothetical protein
VVCLSVNAESHRGDLGPQRLSSHGGGGEIKGRVESPLPIFMTLMPSVGRAVSGLNFQACQYFFFNLE